MKVADNDRHFREPWGSAAPSDFKGSMLQQNSRAMRGEIVKLYFFNLAPRTER
jgi:hypothetical protein